MLKRNISAFKCVCDRMLYLVPGDCWCDIIGLNVHARTKSVALVRERTIPTERPPLVAEVNADFCR
jgi:hypothetical protein